MNGTTGRAAPAMRAPFSIPSNPTKTAPAAPLRVARCHFAGASPRPPSRAPPRSPPTDRCRPPRSWHRHAEGRATQTMAAWRAMSSRLPVPTNPASDEYGEQRNDEGQEREAHAPASLAKRRGIKKRSAREAATSRSCSVRHWPDARRSRGDLGTSQQCDRRNTEALRRSSC